ncbi:MAG: YciI family protein [Acidobacteriaceae bacterium]
MQYLLLIYGEESMFEKMTPVQQQQGMAAYMAYSEALKAAGVLAGSNRLRPVATATTVRPVNGKTQVLDWPFADTKEQLGGYYLIDVPDLDAALSWAAKCPAASHGSVEVRAIWSM